MREYNISQKKHQKTIHRTMRYFVSTKCFFAKVRKCLAKHGVPKQKRKENKASHCMARYFVMLKRLYTEVLLCRSTFTLICFPAQVH
jgi:hypothetical protein